MIVIIFGVLITLSIALIITGYYAESPVIQIVGYGLMFLTSFPLITDNLEYKVGENTSYVYGTNNTLISDSMVNTYVSYGDYRFGYYLAVASVLGFASVFFQWRGKTLESVRRMILVERYI